VIFLELRFELLFVLCILHLFGYDHEIVVHKARIMGVKSARILKLIDDIK